MQPMGRKKIRFPGKEKQWLGKGVKMWWEDHHSSKRSERMAVKRKLRSFGDI